MSKRACCVRLAERLDQVPERMRREKGSGLKFDDLTAIARFNLARVRLNGSTVAVYVVNRAAYLNYQDDGATEFQKLIDAIHLRCPRAQILFILNER